MNKATWPTCEHRGCYKLAAANTEASRHYGTTSIPASLVFHGEDDRRYFCAGHLNVLRGWLQERSND